MRPLRQDSPVQMARRCSGGAEAGGVKRLRAAASKPVIRDLKGDEENEYGEDDSRPQRAGSQHGREDSDHT